jgi:alkylation response protein AidB-like acyl-CoA dehydrogenase
MESTSSISMALAPQEILERAQQLVPRLRDRIFETEELRQLPESSISEAREAGILSLLLPRSLGGAGGGLRDFVDLIRTLAQGDPSAAWTIGFITEHNWMLARFGSEAQDEVFQDGKPAMMAGVAMPPGTATLAEGGYVVTGHWGYCSAVMHSDWVVVQAILGDTRELAWLMLPRADVEVQDTWHVAGMKGTGSHHIKVEGQFVPTHRTVRFDSWVGRRNPGSTLHPEPLYAYDARSLLTFLFPAMAVGAAEAVVADYRDRLGHRRVMFRETPTVAADTVAGQLRFARAVSALRMAEAGLKHAVDLTVRANEATDDEMSDELRAFIKLDCLSVCRMAWEAVEIAVKGSGSSIFKSNDITQHFVRDMQVLLSHATIDEDIMQGKAGEILLGRATESHPAKNFT